MRSLQFLIPRWYLYYFMDANVKLPIFNFLSYGHKSMRYAGEETDWQCLRTTCWGEYLGLRRRTLQKHTENYIMGTFIICRLHRALRQWLMQGKRGGWHTARMGKRTERVDILSLILKGRANWKLRRRQDNNIKIDLTDNRVWRCSLDSGASRQGPEGIL
jgi:hypothetical protein